MTAQKSQLDSSNMKNQRRIIAAISSLLVVVGCALCVTQVVLYPGEFVLTAILSIGAAAATLHRAWLLGVSRRSENLVLTKLLGKWLAFCGVVAAAALYVSTTTAQRQFFGIAAAVVMFTGYMAMVLLFDSTQEPDK